MQRRALLAALGAAAGTTGCLAVEPPRGSDPDGSDPGGSDPGSDDGDPDESGPEEFDPDGPVATADIVTVGAECGGPNDDRAHVIRDDDAIVIEGTLPAPTPCYAATLTDATVEDDTLVVTVDVESDLEDDEGCVQCHGKIDYSATLTLATDVSVDRVTVQHASGTSHEKRLEDGPAAIETIDTACADGSEDESVSVDRTDTGVRITGVRPAPNPCHTATIAEVTEEDDRLTVVINVESTLSGDEVCVECVGAIRYEVAIRGDAPADISEITVDHVDAGSHTETVEAADEESA